MVVNEGLGHQRDKVGCGGDDDKSLAVLLDEDDVKDEDSHREHQFDAFVDQKPGEFVGVGVQVFLHQMAIEGAQNHEEVGTCDHPIVPPWLVGEETEQDAIQDDADEQENGQIFCQHILFHNSTQIVKWLLWFSVKPPLMANS